MSNNLNFIERFKHSYTWQHLIKKIHFRKIDNFKIKKTSTLYNVAVLLTSWNSSSFISSQINSILKQKDVKIHIYVSDDQSSDDTLKVINELTNNENCTILPNLKKYGKPGLNFFSLVERVFEESFDFYCFADHDDIWIENKLSKGIKLMIQSNAQGYSSGYHLYIPDKKVIKIVSKDPNQRKYDYLFSSPGPGCTFILTSSSYKFLKEEIIKHKELFTRCEYHDWAIYAFFRANNLSWIIDSNSYILYRQHSANDTGANQGLKAYIKRIKLFYSGIYEKQINDIVILVQVYKSKEMRYLKEINILHYLFLVLRFSRRNFLHRSILIFLHALGLLNRKTIFNGLNKISQ